MLKNDTYKKIKAGAGNVVYAYTVHLWSANLRLPKSPKIKPHFVKIIFFFFTTKQCHSIPKLPGLHSEKHEVLPPWTSWEAHSNIILLSHNLPLNKGMQQMIKLGKHWQLI